MKIAPGRKHQVDGADSDVEQFLDQGGVASERRLPDSPVTAWFRHRGPILLTFAAALEAPEA